MTREHQHNLEQVTSQQNRFFAILKNHALEDNCPHSVKELLAEIKRVNIEE